MASRLDRLVLLLDTGSTAAVRATAAKQLGDVQRQRPDELYNLLSRVAVHLKGKSWETRIAAGLAIEAIAKNVPEWDPPQPPPGTEIVVKEDEEDQEGLLRFEKFDIETVIKNGAPLVASAGKEFDSDFNDMDPKDRIALQKKQLKQKLGLGTEFMDGSEDREIRCIQTTLVLNPFHLSQVDFFTDADLVNSSSTPSTNNADNKGRGAQQLLDEASVKLNKDSGASQHQPAVDPSLAGLSARERNRLKRKAKLQSKGQKDKVHIMDVSSSSSKKKLMADSNATKKEHATTLVDEDVSDPEDSANSSTVGTLKNKVVVEHKPKPDTVAASGLYSSGDEWPFEGLCEQLCLDLFSPNWEVRHGASIGLREILKAHGSGAGKVIGVTRIQNSSQHNKWLEDVALRLLCVLALDRFADFVSDQVVVPVRETAAQTLGALLQWCSKELSLDVMYKGLLRLIEGSPNNEVIDVDSFITNGKAAGPSNDGKLRWEVRHAGLIGLKYWMAVRTDLVSHVLLPQTPNDTRDTGVYRAILNGLMDNDDDVRAVSSSTLLPIKSLLIEIFPPQKIFKSVVVSLWDCLRDLDDLTSATSSVMELLSELLTQPKIIEVMMTETEMSLEVLMPRLYPFFRHAITSVKIAVLKTVETLIDVGLMMLETSKSNGANNNFMGSGSWVNADLFRLVYQNFLLEEREEIVQHTLLVWKKMVLYLLKRAQFVPDCIQKLVYSLVPGVRDGSLISTWLALVMTPVGTPLNPHLFYKHSHNSFSSSSVSASHRRKKSGGMDGMNVSVHDKAMADQDLTIISRDDIIRGRIGCAVALGNILCALSLLGSGGDEIIKPVEDLLVSYLKSAWSSHRSLASIIVEEWSLSMERASIGSLYAAFGTEVISVDGIDFSTSVKPVSEFVPALGRIWDLAMKELSAVDTGASLLYEELIPSMNLIRTEVSALFNSYTEYGIQNLPPVPPLLSNNPLLNQQAVEGPLGKYFSISTAESIANDIFEQLIVSVKDAPTSLPTKSHPTPPTTHFILVQKRQRLLTSIELFKNAQQACEVRALGCYAGVVVQMGKLPSKLNPIIRSLMNSVKFETHSHIQNRAAQSVGRLIELNIRLGRPQVNEKIIKNLGIFLCSDTEAVGDARSCKDVEGILTLGYIDVGAGGPQKKEVGSSATSGKKGGRKGAANAAATQSVIAEAEAAISLPTNEHEDAAQMAAKSLVKRGAEMALKNILERFGKRSFELCPKVLDLMSSSLKGFIEMSDLPGAHLKCAQDESFGQEVSDTLFTVKSLASYVHSELHPKLRNLLLPICHTIRTPMAILRHSSSKCISSLARIITVPSMQAVIDQIIPLLGDTNTSIHRQGAAECVYHLATSLDHNILPYIIFLIVPILGRMSDPDESVRFLSTHIFAQLIKLVPLESGVPDPDGIPEELVLQRKEERKFLGQLVGTEKVEDFSLPVDIKAELRPYQKEGVSWLAFLNRYGLHGILCDGKVGFEDMGLGKTLQSICILAADHHIRADRFAKTKAPDSTPTPSLVVCPPTLVQHWFHEIANYAGFLKTVVYVGGPSERLRIRDSLGAYDVVVTSYDILRNDIDNLGLRDWNYCILDEGHIIKNGKTKLTKAVKTVRAMKRLVLSGTPIQNSVLELWSIFDFLMPGFLGSERQFNDRFGKPILASRDAKSSSREQEQGALALEALHRQVLPFVLRRMKEDVLNDLPPKIIQDYECELSDVQKLLYEEFAKSDVKTNIGRELSGEGGGDDDDEEEKTTISKKKAAGGGQHVFHALQYLRKLCNHPSLVLTPEHPQFDLVTKKLKADGTELRDVQNSPKLMALKQLLLDCGIGSNDNSASSVTSSNTISPHRALIFCQMKQMIDIIENDLFKTHMPSVTYMRMDGSVENSKRHDIVVRFNADPSIDVLLLTTQVGGLGLNLTGADTVIFVEHDWNPMKDLQAMDRAHRIGQKKVVNVYRLITRGTLEEKIMGLQKFKLNIASSVINQENTGIKSMDTDQILDLFSLGKGDDDKKKAKDKSNGKMSSKEVLENLDSLWDEKEYEDLSVNSFISSLKK